MPRPITHADRSLYAAGSPASVALALAVGNAQSWPVALVMRFTDAAPEVVHAFAVDPDGWLLGVNGVVDPILLDKEQPAGQYLHRDAVGVVAAVTIGEAGASPSPETLADAVALVPAMLALHALSKTSVNVKRKAMWRKLRWGYQERRES